jgi:hypothetical protein
MLRRKNAGAQNLHSEIRSAGSADCFRGIFGRFPSLFPRKSPSSGSPHGTPLAIPRADTMRRYNVAKKILAVSLVLGLAIAAVSFANGQKEPGAAAVPGQTGNEQKLVLTGAVSYKNLIHPTLKTGDKVYELMVPRYLVYQVDLKEGSQVTVEGYQVRGMPPWAQGDDNNIDVFVTKATINGKEYDLSQFRGPRAGGYGYGRGMMGGGYGRGYGMMGGGGYGPGCGF